MTRGTARKVFRAAVSVAAFAAASPAGAQPVCGDHAGMVAQLIGTFGEAHRGAGLAGPRAIYEIWASDATGSWTIIVVAPGGRACVIAAGDYWTDTRPEAPGRRSGLTIPGGVSSLSRGLVDARAPRPGPTTARPLLSGGPR